MGTLPNLSLLERLPVIRTEMPEKFVEKPSRFTESSLLSKMESEGVGTKATRAEIISTLLTRGYIERDTSLKPTELGLKVIRAMEEYCPEIISTGMTERIERDVEAITEGRDSDIRVLASTMSSLAAVLAKLRSSSEKLGSSLKDLPVDARKSTWSQPSAGGRNPKTAVSIGGCPSCVEGKLMVIRSARTRKRFVGCSNFSSKGCRTSAPLPQRGLVRSAKSTCEECRWPRVLVVYPARKTKPWLLCPNLECPSRVKKMEDGKSLALAGGN